MDKKNTKPEVFKLKEVTIDDIRRIVKRLKGGNTQGPDQIPSTIIKIIAPLIEEAIQETVNKSITEATFPDVWKDQEVFPNHKKGSKNEKDNFRPVDHVNEFGKI